MANLKNTSDWTAQWIWCGGKPKKPTHFVYFRKEFEVRGSARKATILCSADSKYRLWVNGKYIGFGPPRGHPAHPYYDTHSVTLRRGRNVIAVLVQHYTVPSSIFGSVEGGLLCQVEMDGQVVVATDSTWRALSSKAHGHLPGFIYPECYDARNEPVDWPTIDFNDRRWPNAKRLRATKLAPPNDLLSRPIPLIREKRIRPRQILAVSPGQKIAPSLVRETDVALSLWQDQQRPRTGKPAVRGNNVPAPWTGKPLEMRLGTRQSAFVVLDFGKEILASPEIAAEGPAGTLVDLGYSECLENDCVATIWQGVRQSERVILRKGVTRHRINQPRGFRFMIVRAANLSPRSARITLRQIDAHEAIYPARRRGGFHCSDPILDRIFDLSARTVNLCMEDGYTDCPWRERSQWVGDAQPETLFSYYCFGAYDLARKAVLEFTSGNTEEGWIPGVFPTGTPMNLPTWGMRVPVIAWEYYLFTGDRSVLSSAYAGVMRQMAWLAKYANKDGLLVNAPGWSFVDWTKLDWVGNDGAVQGWYLEAIDYSAKLAREAGDRKGVATFTEQAARLRKTLAREYWSPRRKAFLKYRPGSERRPQGVPPSLIGQHENFLFALLGVGTAAQRRAALDSMAGLTGKFLPNLGDYQCAFPPEGQKGNSLGEEVIRIGSPFWSYYALLALMESGRVEEAIEYVRLGWGLMLENGATSCWEMWDRHTSHCHGWSAAPAMILPAYVLGVRPVRPGFEAFDVHPRIGSLSWAKGTVPTPRGAINVSWKRGPGRFLITLDVPKGTSARVILPEEIRRACRSLRVDGDKAQARRPVVLAPGRHLVEALAKA